MQSDPSTAFHVIYLLFWVNRFECRQAMSFSLSIYMVESEGLQNVLFFARNACACSSSWSAVYSSTQIITHSS